MNSYTATRFLRGLVVALAPAVAAPLAGPEPASLVERAYVAPDGGVHIVETGRGDVAVPKEKDQVGITELRVADDKKTVGWLAEYENCCTSYPISLKLVIYKDGKVRQRLGDGMMIYDWRFWEGGKQAAFCSGTVHGYSGEHCELRDAITGRSLDTLDGHLDENSPNWAKGLRD
jgi:hypothetical protein